ncbi:hypothetical protein ESB00_16640 [Oleiharenicola lentus]|uniref:DUF4350 domain-containing protein n=1 Tax=Oleiharenicola lentus TaxID=2508720 RepID=A0A4Q1C4I2_9BACT|nr:DUF4350 domain-containing protein [Oleiharenicola lentus]RXK53324.1 hypothetical protein ESB00_16640 [Oleiharenicola lentus]
MNLLRRWFPLLLAAGLVVAACGWLFRLRLGGGDLYPPYSSMRADALGTRALYEALEQMPGLQVARDHRPLERLAARPRLVVLAGLEWQTWRQLPAGELAALNAAAASGARVVLAFRADLLREDRDDRGRMVDPDETEEERAERRKQEKRDEARAQRRRPGVKPRQRTTLAEAWGVTMQQRWLLSRQPGAQRTPEAETTLPAEVAWKSDLYFTPADAAGWRVLYRRAGEPVLMEKAVGRGSLVLLSDAFCLSNEGVHLSRATDLLAWLVGNQRQVVFLEGPLGVLEETGVGHLARRYGLHGALALCVLLGLLYAWRQAVAFIPPVEILERGGEVALAYEPTAGFTALLRRSVDRAALLAACVAEWRRGRRVGITPAAAARLEAVWKQRDPREPLATTYNALVRALKPR